MDKIQSKVIKCCGVNGPQDYVYNSGNSTQKNSTQNNSTVIAEYKVPKSCCQVEAGCKYDQVIESLNGTKFYKDVRISFYNYFLFIKNICLW